MKYLHTSVRVSDLKASLDFYCNKLGLREIRRRDTQSDRGRFTLVFLAAPGDDEAQIEVMYPWEAQELPVGRNFAHVAYGVDDIYAYCDRLKQLGVTICRPPRDGRMAFVRSPDGISIEIVQVGEALSPREPWASMPDGGEW